MSMALDQTRIGQVVTGQMEALERDYGDDEDVEIGAVITIVQVLKKESDDEYASDVRMRNNVGDPYMVLGLMRAAEQTIIQGFGGG
jgi:hypothetical protein